MGCSESANQNTTVHTATDAGLVVNFFDCDGNAVDIGGCNLTYGFYKDSTGSPLVTRTSPDQIIIASNGKSAVILLTPTETNFANKKYFHKLTLVDLNGHILAVFTGQIEFSTRELTSCHELSARVDLDIFVGRYSLDFSSMKNSIYVLLLEDL